MSLHTNPVIVSLDANTSVGADRVSARILLDRVDLVVEYTLQASNHHPAHISALPKLGLVRSGQDELSNTPCLDDEL